MSPAPPRTTPSPPEPTRKSSTRPDRNDHGSRRAPAEYLRVDATSAALYPRFFGRFYTATELARCASWPAADPPTIGNVRGRVGPPIVLIGNDFDNATPLAWTRRLAGSV